MICWLQTRRDLLRTNRWLRAQVSALDFELTAARNDLAVRKELARCTNQQQHIRLAHELHQAHAEIQALRGEDPHLASYDPAHVPTDEDGWVALWLVVVTGLLVGCVIALGLAIADRINESTTSVRAAAEILAPVVDEETTTSTSTTAPPTTTTTTAAPMKRVAASSGAWTWDELAACESGGSWHIHDSLHEGGLQFAITTWDAYKPAGFPEGAHEATREQQIAVAELVLADQGPGAWPHCSYVVGMR